MLERTLLYYCVDLLKIKQRKIERQEIIGENFAKIFISWIGPCSLAIRLHHDN